MTNTKTLRTCDKGHRYYKSSDCPVCPICESSKEAGNGFLAGLSAPALRALTKHGIEKLEDLAQYSQAEILALHGIGPASIPIIKKALVKAGISFKK